MSRLICLLALVTVALFATPAQATGPALDPNGGLSPDSHYRSAATEEEPSTHHLPRSS